MSELTLLRLHEDVLAAATVVAPSWPLSSTIAVNPLSGFEDRPYDEALRRAEVLFGARAHLSLTELRLAHRAGRVRDAHLEAALRRELPGLDAAPATSVAGREVPAVELLLVDLVHGADDPDPVRQVRTLAEELDERDGTDLAAQIDLAAADRCLARAGGLDHADEVVVDPQQAERDLATLAAALEALGVPAWAQRAHLEAHVAAQPGWVAHLRWYDDRHGTDRVLEHLAGRVADEARLVAGQLRFHADGPLPRPATASLRRRADAVCLLLDATPLEREGVERTLLLLDRERRIPVWIDAYERAIQDPLLAAIAAGDPDGEVVDAADEDQPDPVADLVACIDVRSEGLRRRLEARGGYRTFGYAGFFGLPVALRPLAGGVADDQCPVLLTPTTTVDEVPAEGAERDAERAVAKARAAASADDAWHAAKHHPIAPLALAEGAGWLVGPLAAARTAAPETLAWLVDRMPSAAPRTRHERGGLTVAEQAGYVAAIWRLGIGRRPAPLVVLAGHGSRADNNPMESGLACGACGGHRGGPNARLAVAMANDPAVRAELADQGVEIPATTWFVAAEHDTATDRVALLDVDDVPASHHAALAQLRTDLEAAGEAAALDRAGALPGAPGAEGRGGRRIARLRAVRRRGRDWAEPVAELGLAGNHAFVIGPRRLTAHLDLERRVFLHAYEQDLDPEGTVLGGILTAPVVVAQWINAQYNLSTADPEAFGAGTKALHNVVGDVGVLSGAGGDLRRGLALQSVRAGDRLLHEPVRLMAIVEGRREHIDAAIAGSTTLQQLVGNSWISLVARHGPGDPWQQRTRDGWAIRPIPAAAPDREGVPSWAIAV